MRPVLRRCVCRSRPSSRRTPAARDPSASERGSSERLPSTDCRARFLETRAARGGRLPFNCSVSASCSPSRKRAVGGLADRIAAIHQHHRVDGLPARVGGRGGQKFMPDSAEIGARRNHVAANVLAAQEDCGRRDRHGCQRVRCAKEIEQAARPIPTPPRRRAGLCLCCLIRVGEQVGRRGCPGQILRRASAAD